MSGSIVIRLKTGAAHYDDPNMDALCGHGWHFYDDEGAHLATLPLPLGTTEPALQGCLDTLIDVWSSGYYEGKRERGAA